MYRRVRCGVLILTTATLLLALSAAGLAAPKVGTGVLPPGSIYGEVISTTGVPVSGALVEATLEGRLVGDVTTTNLQGQYELTGLTPGTYDMEVLKSGYEPAFRTGVEVLPDQETPENFQLLPN